MRTPVGAADGPLIDPPRRCAEGNDERFDLVILVRGRGQRRLSRSRDEAFLNGHCARPDADPAQCPEAPYGAVFRAIVDAAAARFGRVPSFGVGLCFELEEALRVGPGLAVYDWWDVDSRIALMAEELERWNVGDSFPLWVRGIPCVEPASL